MSFPSSASRFTGQAKAKFDQRFSIMYGLSDVYSLCFRFTYTVVFRASKGHTGSYLAARISECLHEYGIQDKVHI